MRNVENQRNIFDKYKRYVYNNLKGGIYYMPTETNRDRFVRIAEARTQKIINMIDLLGNCANPYNYEYTEKDVDKMFAAIEQSLKECKAKYSETKRKANKFKF